MKYKYFLPALLGVFFTSCVSVEKHNHLINNNLETTKLKQDVDFVKKKLLSQHTDIDMYMPKDSIIYKLDSLKTSIKQPMKPNDFARELSKVVSQFGHGHTYITRLNYRKTPSERKRTKNSKSPFAQLITQGINDRILLKTINTKQKKEEVFAELLSIDSIKYSDFAKEYKASRRGDGKIRTMDYAFAQRYFLQYAQNNIGYKDSITLTLKKNDSVFTRIVKRDFPKKSEKVEKSTTPTPAKILTKEEKQKQKKLAEHRQKIKRYFGYNQETMDYDRSITFPAKEDSTIAVLTIKNFTNGNSTKGYPYIFDSIQKLKIQHLILDLRDNGGGSVRQGNHLYAHLTKTQNPVIENITKVNSKFSLAKNRLSVFKKFNPYTYTFGILSPIVFSIVDAIKTKKYADGNYYYKISMKPKKVQNPYTNNLYVMTNGGSYSMTAILSASLQGEKRAIFVGEETGGDYNGTAAGTTQCEKLTHSKLNLCFGLMSIKPNTQRSQIGRGVMPDISIPQSFEDVMMKKDYQLETLINKVIKK